MASSKYYFEYRPDGKITSYSDINNESDLPKAEWECSEEDVGKLGEGWEPHFTENKDIGIRKSQRLIEKEKLEEREQAKNELIALVEDKKFRIEDHMNLLIKTL